MRDVTGAAANGADSGRRAQMSPRSREMVVDQDFQAATDCQSDTEVLERRDGVPLTSAQSANSASKFASSAFAFC